MGGRCVRRRCQTSLVSKLVVDCAVSNSLEAAGMGGRGLTAGCSVVGGSEWRVLLFGGNSYGKPRVECRL